ncbi:hypothetical protein [Gluconobacter cerinus]|uniref:hypothetical protein n=1 Tax=Gluconobacter cerinus TaxID=38307 RepID=UPI003AB79478
MSLTSEERALLLHMLESSQFPGSMVDAVSALRANLRNGHELPETERKMLAGFIASAQIPGQIVRPVVAILDKLDAPIVHEAPERGTTEAEALTGLPPQA